MGKLGKKKYTFDDCKPYLKEIEISTPRAGTIIAVELLTVLLKDILQGAIITNPDEDNVLQPLKFGHTVNFAYRIGAINKNEYEVLRIINDMRNEYAHEIEIKNPIHKDNIIKICQKLIDSKWCKEETNFVKPRRICEFPKLDFLNVIVNLCYRFTAYVITEKIKLKWTYTDEHKQFMASFIEEQVAEFRQINLDADQLTVTNKQDIAILKYCRVCHKCHNSNMVVVSATKSSEQFMQNHKIDNKRILAIEEIQNLINELERLPEEPITHYKFMCSNCDKIYCITKSDFDDTYMDDLP